MRRASLNDVATVTEILNLPSIRPSLGIEGEVDPTALIADSRNVCLFDQEGGAMFAWRGPGVFEGHLFFRCRGKEALTRFHRCVEIMRSEYGANLLWGPIPPENRAAMMFMRLAGAKSLGPMSTPEGRRELFVLENSSCH